MTGSGGGTLADSDTLARRRRAASTHKARRAGGVYGKVPGPYALLGAALIVSVTVAHALLASRRTPAILQEIPPS